MPNLIFFETRFHKKLAAITEIDLTSFFVFLKNEILTCPTCFIPKRLFKIAKITRVIVSISVITDISPNDPRIKNEINVLLDGDLKYMKTVKYLEIRGITISLETTKFSTLINLEELVLREVDFDDEIFGMSGIMPKLKILRWHKLSKLPNINGLKLDLFDISHSTFKSIEDEDVARIGAIKTLNLSDNALKGPQPFEYFKTVNLDFSNNQDFAAIMSIFKMKYLSNLTLKNCDIKSFVIESPLTSTLIQYLDISENPISYFSGKKLDHLEHLKIKNGMYKEVIFDEHFFQLQDLKTLTLLETRINVENFVSGLGNLKRLKIILFDTEYINNKKLKENLKILGFEMDENGEATR